MPLDLTNEPTLKSTIRTILAADMQEPVMRDWHHRLQGLLAKVSASTPEQWADRTFQLALWEDEAVTSTGMGTVRIQPAIDNEEFRQWFAQEFTTPLPEDRQQVEARLINLYDQLVKRTKALCGRVPRLKINRLLCACYPQYFTSLADVGKLELLYRAMTGLVPEHPVQAHLLVRQRIDDEFTPSEADLATRICISWRLFRHVEKSHGIPATTESGERTGLTPLPAALRRKGLTAIRGYLDTLLTFLPPLHEGLTREEFADHIRQAIPGLNDNSIGTQMNVIVSEFGVAFRDNNIYRLTPRGINLLQSQDPMELADHLLTRVLGVDHVIKALSQKSLHIRDLVAFLKSVNPGWKSDFVPRAMIYWLTSLNVVAKDSSGNYILTDAGRKWAELITWEPESLHAIQAIEPEVQMESSHGTSLLPAFGKLHETLKELTQGKLAFERDLIQRLHAGLWFHPVRHFAVLTGISGSGKTQLALNYARALTGQDNAEAVRLIPVQPGWFDPSPLLGYINPLQPGLYRSAPFLELLLAASEDPSSPYVAILDEMNLSHPEQYLAPILSAMETEGMIELHDLPEDATAIPGRIRYPRNLAIIGTLNMDETTHGLSDKVLDRAYTLEFWDIDIHAFPGWATTELPDELKDHTRVVLSGLAEALAPVRMHFGWRIIHDVLGYLAFAHQNYGQQDHTLDEAIYAKVLPKLRGESTSRFQAALANAQGVLEQNGLKRCATKLKEMRADLNETGTARFWR